MFSVGRGRGVDCFYSINIVQQKDTKSKSHSIAASAAAMVKDHNHAFKSTQIVRRIACCSHAKRSTTTTQILRKRCGSADHNKHRSANE